MKAIIRIDVPEYQIGQEVSCYFKDTMMIKGVVQEPSGDLISRQAVLDIINFEDKWLLDAKWHNADTEIAFSGMKSKVSALPSVNPQEPCDDAISRQAVLDELNKWDWQELYLPIHFKENIIDVVPSVNPQKNIVNNGTMNITL